MTGNASCTYRLYHTEAVYNTTGPLRGTPRRRIATGRRRPHRRLVTAIRLPSAHRQAVRPADPPRIVMGKYLLIKSLQ